MSIVAKWSPISATAKLLCYSMYDVCEVFSVR